MQVVDLDESQGYDLKGLQDSKIDFSIYEQSQQNISDQEIQSQLQENQYQKIRLIGHGSFGKVYLVKNTDTCQEYVMKQMSTFNKTQEEVQDMLKESHILQQLDHPNIIKFQDVFINKKQKLNIIMEYAQSGDLSQYIKARKGQLIAENQILGWCSQLVSAIGYLQQKKIMHRDLKCENLFLSDEMILKIGDFGISKVLSRTKEQAKTFVGTPYYISPEILQGKPYQFKSDLWSLGIIIYELCSLTKPFEADSLHFLALKIIRGKFKQLSQSHYTTNLRNLVSNLLQIDPSKRMSIDQMKALPVFAEGKHQKKTNPKKQPQIFKKNIVSLVNVDDTRNKKQPYPNKMINNNQIDQRQIQVDQEQVRQKIKFDRDNQRKNMSEDIQQKKKVQNLIQQEAVQGQRQMEELGIDNYGPLKQEYNELRQLNQSEELSLQYIVTESTKLEELRQLLEDQMGITSFVAAYKVISNTLELNTLEEIEEKYGKNSYRDLLPFLDEQSVEKYLPFLFTLIYLEQDVNKQVD